MNTSIRIKLVALAFSMFLFGYIDQAKSQENEQQPGTLAAHQVEVTQPTTVSKLPLIQSSSQTSVTPAPTSPQTIIQIQPQQPAPQVTQLPTQPALVQVQSQPPPQTQIQVQPAQTQLSSKTTVGQSLPSAQTQNIIQVQTQPPTQQIQPQAQIAPPTSGQSQVQIVQIQMPPQPTCGVQTCCGVQQCPNVCNVSPVVTTPKVVPPPVKVTKPKRKSAPPLKIEKPQPEVQVCKSPCSEKENKYQSYFEVGVGGIDYSDQSAKMFTVYDLFVPLATGHKDEIFFADLRVLDQSGSAFEGSAQVGYRYLLPHKNDLDQMLGIYVSYDRLRSSHKEFFNQLVFGGEYWRNDWFIGGNFYLPIGAKKQLYEETSTYLKYEEAARGVDAQIGRVIANGLTGYVGGFYFDGNYIKATKGISAKLEYLFYQGPEKRFLGIFDSAKLVAGMRKFFSQGLLGFVELKLGIGIGSCPRANLGTFESHMVELVRRAPQMIAVIDPEVKLPATNVEEKSDDISDLKRATRNVQPDTCECASCPTCPECTCKRTIINKFHNKNKT